jgi:beta-N-acetylhexosaminidase
MQPLIKVPIFIVLVLSSTFFTASRSEETKSIVTASLADKIAQLLIVGFRGLSVDKKFPIVRDIQKHNVGGVLLFDYDRLLKRSKRNIKSPEQVKLLIEQLQSYSRTPLFIAIDQEGGKIQRLKPKFGFPRTVSAQYLGKKHKPERTYKQASKMAQTLAQLGINFNLAPVVDLNLNPNNPVIGKLRRSFSANPDIVTQHAIEFIKAHHAHGVLTALKHLAVVPQIHTKNGLM